MLTIDPKKGIQTVILTYDVAPGASTEVRETLSASYKSFISHQPGFVAAAIHINDAQTRVASYSQWETREAFQAVLRSEEMRETNRKLSDLSKGFIPVMYDVAEVFLLNTTTPLP